MPDMSRTMNEGSLVSDKEPEKWFPHTLHFDDKDLKAFDVEDVDVDDTMLFVGRVKVTSVHSHADESGKHIGATFTFTEGRLEQDKETSRAERLFGSE